jgi:hypothetical protein
MRSLPSPFIAFALLVAVCASPGCRGRTTGTPAITFDVIPPAAPGGGEKLFQIAGRVTGHRPGQQIVLFAKSGVWWVQPLTVHPFTAIKPDATWRNRIHPGTEYAALLVDPGYQPPATIEELPKAGTGVLAVATVKGTGSYVEHPRKRLTFSGYEWEIRDTPSERGGSNDYDASNAWTDDRGHLHLKLAQRDGRWTSAEVILTRALGYGTYVFVLQDVSKLDPAATVGLLTWDDQGADQNHRELDIEFSQWGDPNVANAQYVIQPYYVPANVSRFTAPPGRLTHSFRWAPGLASFRTVRAGGLDAGAPVVARHEFTSGVPAAGNERVCMNLYYFRYSPSPPQRDVEVVIERFQYLP